MKNDAKQWKNQLKEVEGTDKPATKLDERRNETIRYASGPSGSPHACFPAVCGELFGDCSN